MDLVIENLKQFEHNVSEALSRAGRKREDLHVVVVSKNRPVDQIKTVVSHGYTFIGENRIQEARSHMSQIPDMIEWHMVGHLQTNKAKEALNLFTLVHSIDSLHVALALEKAGQRLGKSIDVLVQVNVSGEKTKFGVNSEEIDMLIEEMGRLDCVNVKGLMTIAPFTEEEKIIRSCFKGLKELGDTIRDQAFSGVEMKYLSMGMSNDYEIAIEEGANILRIGSAIYDKPEESEL